jgi:hypothetical protein
MMAIQCVSSSLARAIFTIMVRGTESTMPMVPLKIIHITCITKWIVGNIPRARSGRVKKLLKV